MMIAVKILLSVAIVALACLLSSILNAKRNRRIRQFPLIFVAAIISVTHPICFLCYWISFAPAQTIIIIHSLNRRI